MRSAMCSAACSAVCPAVPSAVPCVLRCVMPCVLRCILPRNVFCGVLLCGVFCGVFCGMFCRALIRLRCALLCALRHRFAMRRIAVAIPQKTQRQAYAGEPPMGQASMRRMATQAGHAPPSTIHPLLRAPPSPPSYARSGKLGFMILRALDRFWQNCEPLCRARLSLRTSLQQRLHIIVNL